MMQRRSTARGPRFIRNSWLLILILALLGVSIWILSSSGTSVLHRQPGYLGLRLGLDLKGGVQVVYTGVFADNTTGDVKSKDIDAAISSMRKRIDKYGVVEPVIQKQGNDRILVQLPGIGDVDEARRLIEQTAFLEFREVEMNGSNPATLGDYLSENRTDFFGNGDSGALDAQGAPMTINREFVGSDGQPVVFIQRSDTGLEYVDADGNAIDPATIDPANKSALSWMPAYGELTSADVTTKRVLIGSYLTDASPQTSSQSSVTTKISVGITWNSEGTSLFNEAAKRIRDKGSLGKSQRDLGIFLDNELLSAPQVFPSDMTASSYGSSASITGNYTWNEARTLAIQLTSGALPISLKELFSSNVSATLGADFVHKAFVAALIGLLVVVLFMIMYYRLPGVIASLALVIYAILVLAIYKLIPVTMTLAGVAGFIVSLGMAVDANVLIFERMKEELRAGRTLKAATDAGFSRAWLAIRDSNVSTFIACGILYWFGSSIVTSPAVKGFALTLFIGVAVSMFSAIVSTRTFLLSFTGPWAAKRLTWFGVEAKSEVQAKDA